MEEKIDLMEEEAQVQPTAAEAGTNRLLEVEKKIFEKHYHRLSAEIRSGSTSEERRKQIKDEFVDDYLVLLQKGADSSMKHFASRALVKYIDEYADRISAVLEQIGKERKSEPKKRDNRRVLRFLGSEIAMYKDTLANGGDVKRWKLPAVKQMAATPKKEVGRSMEEVMRPLAGKEEILSELEAVRKKVTEKYYHQLSRHISRCKEPELKKRLVKETVGDYVILLLSPNAVNRTRAKAYILKHIAGNEDIVLRRLNETEMHFADNKLFMNAVSQIWEKMPKSCSKKRLSVLELEEKQKEINRMDTPLMVYLYVDSHEWDIADMTKKARDDFRVCSIKLGEICASKSGETGIHDSMYPAMSGGEGQKKLVLLDGFDSVSIHYGGERRALVQAELAGILSGKQISYVHVDAQTGKTEMREYNARNTLVLANGKFPMLEYIIDARLCPDALAPVYDMKELLSKKVEAKTSLGLPNEKLLAYVRREDMAKYGIRESLLSKVSDIIRLPTKEEEKQKIEEFTKSFRNADAAAQAGKSQKWQHPKKAAIKKGN